MINSPNGVHSFLNSTKDNFSSIDDLILTFETPSVEEIARAIWQRQRSTTHPDAISFNAKWLDQTIPSKFWNEFLLDAQAVLWLLYKKHMDYQNKQ
jgi:hypothetical protein